MAKGAASDRAISTPKGKRKLPLAAETDAGPKMKVGEYKKLESEIFEYLKFL